MSVARHCDGPECQVWTRNPKAPGWIDVLWRGFPVETGVDSLHFDSWDCVLRYAAKQEPTEILE